ncbi:unnamed protein product [Amoebophrya sp. A25]|nr:unnamed protein product [Amoebophrya sp. A25]|eukprot:GSA25T00011461001.1
MRCAALKLHRRRRKYFQASSLEVDSDTLPLSCIIKRTAPHPGICRGVFLQSSKGEPLRWRISNVHERIVPGIEGRWQYIVAPCFKDLSEFVAFSTTVHHCVEDESEVGPRHYRYCPCCSIKGSV